MYKMDEGKKTTKAVVFTGENCLIKQYCRAYKLRYRDVLEVMGDVLSTNLKAQSRLMLELQARRTEQLAEQVFNERKRRQELAQERRGVALNAVAALDDALGGALIR